MIISAEELAAILRAEHGDPHRVLGMHPISDERKGDARVSGRMVVRAFVADAESCEVVDCRPGGNNRYPLERIADEGFFEGVLIPMFLIIGI